MVLFDHLFCGTCAAVQDYVGWSLLSSAMDAFLIVGILLLILGYTLEVPIWLAINIGVNLGLKYLIGEERPGICGCGPGMPSSTAQLSTFFFFVFLRWEYHIWTKKRWPACYLVYHLLVAATITSLISISRGVLGYHSVPQILVGAAIGIAFGALYLVVHEGFCCCCCGRSKNTRVISVAD